MNVIILSGYVVEANEKIKLRTVPENQDRVTSFTLAVTKDKPSQNRDDSAFYITIVGWDKVADFCNETLEKGMYIELEGYVRTSRRPVKGIEKVIYENGTEIDTLTVPIFEVNAKWIRILHSKKELAADQMAIC